MDWDRLRIFHAVAMAGSFTKAAAQLSLSQPAISRQVASLEEELGVALFRRGAKGLVLTEQGDMLFRTAKEVASRLAAVENAVSESKDRPKGPLKVTTTFAFGTLWLLPKLREFMELYPDITVSLIVDDHELDLHMREADVALRFYPSKQPDLIQRPLLKIPYAAYASQGYLNRFGVPAKAEDLSRHRLIVYGEEMRAPVVNANWLLTKNAREPRRAAFKVNNLLTMIHAVKQGLGISSLPTYVERDHPELIRLLPQMEGPEATVYLLYPEEMKQSRRIGAFREFMQQKIAEYEGKNQTKR